MNQIFGRNSILFCLEMTLWKELYGEIPNHVYDTLYKDHLDAKQRRKAQGIKTQYGGVIHMENCVIIGSTSGVTIK